MNKMTKYMLKLVTLGAVFYLIHAIVLLRVFNYDLGLTWGYPLSAIQIFIPLLLSDIFTVPSKHKETMLGTVIISAVIINIALWVSPVHGTILFLGVATGFYEYWLLGNIQQNT